MPMLSFVVRCATLPGAQNRRFAGGIFFVSFVKENKQTPSSPQGRVTGAVVPMQNRAPKVNINRRKIVESSTVRR